LIILNYRWIVKTKKANRVYLNFLETHINSIKNLTISIDTVMKSEGDSANYEKFKALKKHKKRFSKLLFHNNNEKESIEENDIDWMDVLINSNISIDYLTVINQGFQKKGRG